MMGKYAVFSGTRHATLAGRGVMTERAEAAAGKASHGRREQAKAERVERILAAVRALLHEEPGERLTMPQIADRAGVSQMTIFNLIGARDDLWAALAEEALADWQEDVAAIQDPQERARAIVEKVAQAVVDDAPVFRALISSWGDSGRVLQREPSRALLDCLEQAVEERQIAPDIDVRRLASLIFSGVVGLVHQWAAGLVDNQELVTRACDLVDVAFTAGRPGCEPRRWQLETSRADSASPPD
jgi:AcrR family transcriptional regulator